MKSSKRCPRCEAHWVGNLESLPELAAGGTETYQALGIIRYRMTVAVAGRGVAPDVNVQIGPVGQVARFVVTPTGPQLTTKAGTIEAWICTRCGFLEQYLQDPQWLDLAKLEGFTWMKEESMSTAACAKCHGHRLGQLAFLPDTTADEQTVEPRCVGVSRVDGKRVGELYAVVCADCGYLETYVANARNVPFEGLVGFSWAEEKASPYR